MSRVFSGLRWAPSTLCVWLWGAQHGQLTVFSLHPKALNHSPDCCMSLAPGPDGKHRAWFAHLEAQSPIASLEPHCGVRLWLQCSPNPPSPPRIQQREGLRCCFRFKQTFPRPTTETDSCWHPQGSEAGRNTRTNPPAKESQRKGGILRVGAAWFSHFSHCSVLERRHRCVPTR